MQVGPRDLLVLARDREVPRLVRQKQNPFEAGRSPCRAHGPRQQLQGEIILSSILK